jgi:hypothetical protein
MKVQLGRFLMKVLPAGFPRTYRGPNNGPMNWVLPSLDECRQAYERMFRVTREHAGWLEVLDGDLEL